MFFDTLLFVVIISNNFTALFVRRNVGATLGHTEGLTVEKNIFLFNFGRNVCLQTPKKVLKLQTKYMGLANGFLSV